MTIDLAGMRTRACAASAGSWLIGASVDRSENALVFSRDGLVAGCGTGAQAQDDAVFIAYAREDVPTLLDAIDAAIELHPRDGMGWCEYCTVIQNGGNVARIVEHPCPTLQALGVTE